MTLTGGAIEDALGVGEACVASFTEERSPEQPTNRIKPTIAVDRNIVFKFVSPFLSRPGPRGTETLSRPSNPGCIKSLPMAVAINPSERKSAIVMESGFLGKELANSH